MMKRRLASKIFKKIIEGHSEQYHPHQTERAVSRIVHVTRLYKSNREFFATSEEAK